ncbi:MAG: Potassium uptake protein, integral membrane component, KtrB [Candidatus Saccharicenans subterraneus]|uniref:Potassium uptake protein, integral membrane component, KtrB n=1 Tax=Candidatus Saccharicenans subterraneus TaxID=2508984 RepID=A0A3E2BN83_9BACT|nr:MAG: Potassium uptake protein, integral membrane component, KtrB [Candidatus Saccharicenans subterraneum]
MNNFKKKLVHPPRLLALSFLAAIIVGTIILSLPFSTRAGRIPLIDALFTSTSAICVTGLIVVDTPNYFSPWGLGILLALIQLGGLGIMTFSSFILMTAGRRVSLSDKLVVEGSFRPAAISDFRSLLRDVFLFTFGFELIGAALLMLKFSGVGSWSRAVALSVFHSVSAFCNAGFSLFSDNLAAFRGDTLVNLVMIFLIVFGGLGFFVLQEIKLALRSCLQKERVRFSLHTKFVVAITLGIILTGAILLFLMEFDRGFSSLPLKEKVLGAVFQVVSARTAGFNTVDLNSLSVASLLLLILIMFVGASPGSTGGGVKTTTFGVIFAFLRSRIHGHEVPQIFSRAIKNEDIIKAYTLVSLAMSLVFASTLALLIIQPQLALKEALFEVVSAFGTVGLSLGITPNLHPLNKLILVVTMYLGRIGPLTMLYAFSRVKPAGHYQFIEESIMVG